MLELNVYRAYVVFRKLNGLARNQNSRLLFLEFLKVGEAYRVFVETDKLPEDAECKIRWLTGPNAEVMYKIWRAQNGKS